MKDEPSLHPATMDEVVETIAFALHHDGRGRIAAERVAAHLEQSGFVFLKRRPIERRVAEQRR